MTIWVFAWAMDGDIDAQLHASKSQALRAVQQFANNSDVNLGFDDWAEKEYADNEIGRLIFYLGEAGYDALCEEQTP